LQISNLTENREGEISSIQVTGLVGAPRNTRSNRDYLSFFVNRRWINNRMLTYAVEEAYHGLIMQGKHPVAVINITIPSPEIDINVHPSKTEIKFKDERAVFGAVQKAVRQTLVQSSPVPQVEETRPKFSVPETSFIAPSSMVLPEKKEFPPVGHPDQPAPVPLISLPLLRVLGQMSRSYIAAEGPDGLYLIDQHAAHERIQFENIRQQRESGKMDVQGLLQPVTFEVDIRQAPVMSSHLDEIVALGFNIEPFGSRTYLVRAVPAMLRDKDWAGMLRESLDNPSSRWSENLAVTLACHSAIRAGQVLSDSEMRELIKQLEKTALPHTCPHGRPTMIQLSMQRIEKEFGRTP
jgi:DNA mismatch repair protein MutL